jgi:hypothetical protein
VVRIFIAVDERLIEIEEDGLERGIFAAEIYVFARVGDFDVFSEA